jgi:hypothetical protein
LRILGFLSFLFLNFLEDLLFEGKQIGNARILLESGFPLRILNTVNMCYSSSRSEQRPTFLDSFLSFLCFAALAFSILCLNRTGVRFDLETVHGQSWKYPETED